MEEASKPIVIGDDVKIGILSIADTWRFAKANAEKPGVMTWDYTDRIQAIIKELRNSVDWVVMVVHGGYEFCDIVLPDIRKRYRSLLACGADIIVGHHPHVVQNYELYDNKAIFYSLGNFIFDTENQRDFAHTENGILLGIEFTKEKFEFDHLPVFINRDVQSVEVGNTPVVFSEIDEKNYQLLWPCVAKKFDEVETIKLKKFSKLAKAPKIVLLFREVYRCRKQKGRTIQKGRILNSLGKWKNTDLQDILGYIQNA